MSQLELLLLLLYKVPKGLEEVDLGMTLGRGNAGQSQLAVISKVMSKTLSED